MTWCSVWLAAGCFIGSDIGEILHFESTISIEEKVDFLGRGEIHKMSHFDSDGEISWKLYFTKEIFERKIVKWDRYVQR